MTHARKALHQPTSDQAGACQEVNTFSFLAESASDLLAFIEAATLAGFQGLTVTREVHDGTTPDVEAEVKAQASLEQMSEVMRAIDGGHAMIQTLRQCPLAVNSMKRDHALA